MFQTILSAITVYLSTSIDYLFLLVLLFSTFNHKGLKAQIYAGQYLGTALLVLTSLIAVYVIHFIPSDWVIGLLGLIPLFLGIRFAIVGEDDDEEEVSSQLKKRQKQQLFWSVTLLTIASGGDNLGIYIPYFATLATSEIVIALIIFIFGVVILCEVSERIAKVPTIMETIETYERIIVPTVFILLGLYIMYENGIFSLLFN
ncbi:CadD family cadmium resistance transporter [Aerococcus suis]|nr:CadD family cadmium resistance transporter [Aerococcus suis]